MRPPEFGLLLISILTSVAGKFLLKAEERLEVITGVPQAIASNAGKPKPSHKLGKTIAIAVLTIVGSWL